jgi:hypothetical protein
MLHIKISGETPRSGVALCKTCKYASIVIGQNCEERIICSGDMFPETRGIVRFKVAQCGSYHPINTPWKHEMEAIAWKVEARRRGPTGFTPQDNEMIVTIKPPSNGYGSPDAMPEGSE